MLVTLRVKGIKRIPKLSILICFACAETKNCLEILDKRLITAAYYYISLHYHAFTSSDKVSD